MIGQTISHYKIIEKLGEGGMGVVYKAQDLKLDRFVAIKVLAPHLSRDKEAITRFIHEAKAASALDHSHIGTIHDIDETTEGQTFIVMAYYEGETLHDRMKRGDVTTQEALAVTSQIASGLAQAHEKGIVHRDIKPSNIIITRDGQAKIMDFGLAKLAGGTKLTRTGSSLGTVAYMSPEQAQGREVDERSDIFSLGAVLYELIAGRLPFKGEHEAAVLYEIVHEEPEPLSGLRKEIPEGLERIVATALQKDASARYQKALDMKSDIDELARTGAGVAGGAPMTVRRGWPGSKARMWVFVAVISIAIAAGAVALLRVRPMNESPAVADLSLAVMDFRNIANPSDTLTAVAITTLVELGLTQSSPIRPISRDLVYDKRRRLFGSGRGAIGDDQVLEIAREVKSTMYLAAQILEAGTEKLIAWRLVDTRSGKNIGMDKITGTRQAELADGIVRGVLPLLAGRAGSEEIAPTSSVDGLATSSEEAYRHYVKGLLAFEQYRDQDAVAELERAVAIDSTFALAYYQLSYAHYRLSLSIQGLPREYAERAWVHRDRLGIKDRMNLEAFREILAQNVPASLKTYREILARWPDDRATLGILSRNLYMDWRYEEALSVSGQGLALYPDDMVLQVVYQNALPFLGRNREALEASLSFVAKHPGKEYLLNELGQRYWEAGLPDSAEAVFRRVLAADPDNWLAEWSIAYCYYARGDVDRAIDMLEGLMARPGVTDYQRLRILVQTGFGGPLVTLPAEIGRFERSFELLREYESGGSATAVAAVRLESYLLSKSGRVKEAVDSARAGLSRVTAVDDSVRLNIALVEALISAGSIREARALLAELQGMDESDQSGRTRFYMRFLPAKLALAEGDFEGALKAIRELEKFARPPAHEWGIYYHETLAQILWKSGRLKEAVDAYRDLLAVFGGHAISHYELGRVYEQMKRPADARREYSKFLEMCSQADKGWPPVEDARKRLVAI